MILYLDTSALVKLYVNEDRSDDVHAWVASATAVATSRVTWAEAAATLARREREQPNQADIIADARDKLRVDWPSFVVVDVSQDVVEPAGRLAMAMALRGYDAVQLASADLLARAEPRGFVFACFDRRLNVAATALQMAVPPGLS
jgi:predicted nucleic acid-binding protein